MVALSEIVECVLTSNCLLECCAGLSLLFVTTVFKTYLIDQSVDQFGLNLYKAGMSDRLLDFFPPNKRDEDSFARHFEAEDMKQLVTFQNKKQLIMRKDNIIENVKSLLEESKVTEVRKGSDIQGFKWPMRRLFVSAFHDDTGSNRCCGMFFCSVSPISRDRARRVA